MIRISPLHSVLLLSLLFASAGAQEYKPQVAEASKDGELALQGFVLPEGMSSSLLAAEPAIANPVAFYTANDGRVFVCETFRQEVGVEDNRNHMNWLLNDLRLESVEERLAMFKKYLGDDVSKYAIQHDRIRVLEDTNGDGTFDSDKVFAGGFNDILDGTGAGVIEHDGKVFYTCIPNLWSLEDTDGDGIADRTDALHHGYGVRVAFRGHDMHGLTMGPDGRLYFSIGDRGYNVITKEGERLKRADTGAVFRCDPDGAHLEVFAYGLRNPQELAFDDDGNLFTGDNNSDSGDKARWVYVVQDGDTGWRMYFQYENDRGPWNRERMWYPYRADEETTTVQPAYIVPPVANLADGPSGLTYYPGLGLSDRYKNHFFMADFRGTAGNSGIRSFSVKPNGATFELTDSHQFIWSILGTDVDFAPDGSLYITDWVNGWNGEGKGRLYRFADDENISAVTGANVPQLLSGGITNADTPELLHLLGHRDRRVRQTAQFALVKRPDQDAIWAGLNTSGNELFERQATFAKWQMGLNSIDSAKRFVASCNDAIRQGRDTDAKILADLVSRHGTTEIMNAATRDDLRGLLRKFLETEIKAAQPNWRVAGFFAVALGSIGTAADVETLYDLLQRNDNEDPVLRHQAVMGLVKIGERNPDALLSEALAGRPAAVRLALVVALRRLHREELVQLLDDADPTVVAEAARAIAEQGSDSALNKLSFLLLLAHNHPRGSNDPVVVRRALEASYRLGGERHALVVARVAGDVNRPEDIRVVAANMLTSWNDPRQTNTVDGRWRHLPKRNVEGLKKAVTGDLAGMLAGPKPVREAAVKLAAQLDIADVIPTLEGILANLKADESTRVAAFRALSQLSENVEDLLSKGREDSSEAIRLAALELLTERNPGSAVSALAMTLESGGVKARQKAIMLLGKINTPESRNVIAAAFSTLSDSQSDAVALDLLTVADLSDSTELKALSAKFREQQARIGTKISVWSECLEGGDAEQGKVIFFGRAAASCRRCHKVNGDGADVGPDLSAIAKDKDRNYLLEAIVDPNAKIARGFETTIIVDLDGRIHSGIIKEETDETVKLMTPKGAVFTVAKEDIDERAKGQSGMPADIAKNMTRSEIRDLVEYLWTLKASKDTAHGTATAE